MGQGKATEKMEQQALSWEDQHHCAVLVKIYAGKLVQTTYRAPADLEQLCLPGYGQLVFFVDYGFALSNPTSMSASSKKSFSGAGGPILACKGSKSTISGCSSLPLNTLAARS